MNTIENMITRRSIRKYKSDMIPKETIDKICEAGTFAPTGMNRQSPIIIAVNRVIIIRTHLEYGSFSA